MKVEKLFPAFLPPAVCLIVKIKFTICVSFDLPDRIKPCIINAPALTVFDVTDYRLVKFFFVGGVSNHC